MFDFHTNQCDYLALGNPDGLDVWLEGEIVSDEFVFNGRLFMKNGTSGTVIDNFPKGPTPEGWSQSRSLHEDGYELRDPNGELVFSYRIADKVCFVKVNLYKADGSVAAFGGQGELISYVPISLGRNGIRIG